MHGAKSQYIYFDFFFIGSKCRFRSTGVIESNLRVCVISLAAEF